MSETRGSVDTDALDNSSSENLSTVAAKYGFEEVNLTDVTPGGQIVPTVVKPKLFKLLPLSSKEDATDEEKAQSQQTKKEVTTILNKLKPGNYNEISAEIFNNLGFFDKIPEIVDLIFDKVVEVPELIQACAYLCMALNTAEEVMTRPNFQRLFRSTIIRKIQYFIGADLTQYDPKTIDNALKFLTMLYSFDVINYRIIENCVVVLIQAAEASENELIFEYAIIFMKYLGPIAFEKNVNVQQFDAYIEHFDKFRGKVSTRIEHMITDLLNRRKAQWIEPSTTKKQDEAGPSNASCSKNDIEIDNMVL